MNWDTCFLVNTYKTKLHTIQGDVPCVSFAENRFNKINKNKAKYAATIWFPSIILSSISIVLFRLW